MLEANIIARIGRTELTVALTTGGGTLTLVGPNGAGKTSLLLAMLGIIRPKAGRITLFGEVLFDEKAGVNLPPEERGLGYVPQDYGLFPHMTALENVAFAIECRDAHATRQARRERAQALLDELSVGHVSGRRPETLSGGERQRVALARALSAKPRALLLDESLAALDVGVRRQTRIFLREYLMKLGLPAICVTHDPADAAALGGVVAVIEGGRIVQSGTFDELCDQPASPFVSELVAGVRP